MICVAKRVVPSALRIEALMHALTQASMQALRQAGETVA